MNVCELFICLWNKYSNWNLFIEGGVEKKIQCKICYKKFRRKWNLEQHVKRIHRENSKGEDTQLNDKDEQDDSEEENEELDKLNDLSSAPK